MKMKFILPKILEERGISKLQFSKDIGVSYPTIDNLCNGETQGIKFYILENICNVLNCMPNDLFEYTDILNDTQGYNASTNNTKKRQDLRIEAYKNELRKFIETKEFQNVVEDLLLDVANKCNKDDTE